MATLSAITRTLLAEARKTPGTAQARMLGRGLMVAVRVDGETIQLKLERTGVNPSPQEFKTVLKHFPADFAPAGEVLPTGYKSGPRRALVGKWVPAQAAVL